MTEIAELEGRLTAALDRIGAGLNRVGEAQARVHEEELATERAASAKLEERVRAIQDRQETMVSALQDEVATLRRSLSETDADLQRLRSVNAELRSSNEALRAANAEGVGDPTLINEALQAEVEALRALEENSRGEIDRALAFLDPYIPEAADA
jgi:chromosome segregation ATPase